MTADAERQPLLLAGSSPHNSSASSRTGRLTSRLKRARAGLREVLAELCGTFLLVLIGDGVVAQYVLSGGDAGSWLGVNVAWAGAVMMGSLVAGSVSGAHLNPAVSLCFAIIPSNGERFPLRKLPGYITGQLIGGFLAAAVVYAQYWNQIDIYEGGLRTVPGVARTQSGTGVSRGPTAGIFATYPLPTSLWTSSFLSEFLAAFVLMLGIYAISSKRNAGLGQAGAAFAVFVLLLCVGAADGWQTGYAINAARDLAPRAFSALIYGPSVFAAGNHYWWIPVVAPVVGCLAGGATWVTLVGEDEGDL